MALSYALVGPPKCGNALMWRMMQSILGKEASIEDFRQRRHMAVARSHLPDKVAKNSPTRIGIIRDPRDAHVSWSHFGGNHRTGDFNPGWFMTHAQLLTKRYWIPCVKGFEADGYTVFRYEDVVADVEGAVEKVAAAMKVKPHSSPAEIAHAIRPETAKGHARHVTPGEWKEFFLNPELEKLMCDPIRHVMKKWGYE